MLKGGGEDSGHIVDSFEWTLWFTLLFGLAFVRGFAG